MKTLISLSALVIAAVGVVASNSSGKPVQVYVARSSLHPPTKSLISAPRLFAPVYSYILMGQSNMLGEGKVTGPTTNGTLEYAVGVEGKYSYLGAVGKWKVSKNVRSVFVMGSGGADAKETLFHNEFQSVNTTLKKTIGPELGIGHAFDGGAEDVMLLKSCIGDRALGWDLLPPGQSSFNAPPDSKGVEYTYAGYHQSPSRWVKGTKPVPIGWEAGEQYDGDVARADAVLADKTGKYYPGASSFEVAGFFWWQGDRDSRDMNLAGRYEQNLVALIKQLRLHYKAPNAKFVTASLGQTAKGATDGGGLILDAMLNVADGKKYPEFKGNVAAVYTHPLSMGSSSGAHYGGNAETYMNIGEAMGAAMAKLKKGEE